MIPWQLPAGFAVLLFIHSILIRNAIHEGRRVPPTIRPPEDKPPRFSK